MLLQIYHRVCQWKNFWNRSISGEDINKSLVTCFFDSRCISYYDYTCVTLLLYFSIWIVKERCWFECNAADKCSPGYLSLLIWFEIFFEKFLFSFDALFISYSQIILVLVQARKATLVVFVQEKLTVYLHWNTVFSEWEWDGTRMGALMGWECEQNDKKKTMENGNY